MCGKVAGSSPAIPTELFTTKTKYMTEIVVKQIPVITHDLVKVGQTVTERIEALNLANQVATEETIQTLKSTRAELNKEAKEWEEQRKTVKNAVMNPYNEFEETYKEEVINKYKEADTLLKDAIGEFELKAKTEKRNNVIQYFKELIESYKTPTFDIDFLTFERVGIDINLTITEKKYKEQCAAFVAKVIDDILLIDRSEYPAEMLVLYKQTLNASKAITEVRERKEKEKAEKARLQMAETNRRTALLMNLSLVPHDITRTFNHSKHDDIYISLHDVENLSRDEFNVKLVEIESVINSRKEPETTPVAAPLQAPTVVRTPTQTKKEEILTAIFEVNGTMNQLLELGKYMKQNNITFKNL